MTQIACQFNVGDDTEPTWTQYLPAVPAVGNLVLHEEQWYAVKAVAIHTDHDKEPSGVGYGILLEPRDPNVGV